METAQNHQIIWIVDDRISREKLSVFSRVLTPLKQKFPILILRISQTSEAEILNRIKAEKSVRLVVAPLKEYLSWKLIDAFLGTMRTRGPTFAGHFTEPTPLEILEDRSSSSLRKIVLDCYHLTPAEVFLMVQSLVDENNRSGLLPLLQPNTPIYCENWFDNQGLGHRIDLLLGLSQVSKTDWAQRASSLRILLTSLWTLVYEEGPGKGANKVKREGDSMPLAYFQFAADPRIAVMRLFFHSLPMSAPLEALKVFIPDRERPSRASQLLLRFSDFLRVHSVPETHSLEIVTGLLPSAPAERSFSSLHTFWIDPLADALMSERPYSMPNPQSPRLVKLSSEEIQAPRLKLVENKPSPAERIHKKLINDATQEIRQLKSQLHERNEKIRELRLGGIGASHPLPPPEPEDLLEAFQERFFDAQYQIRQFELQLERLKAGGAQSYEMEALRLKMEALANREKSWIQKILLTLQSYRATLKKNSPK